MNRVSAFWSSLVWAIATTASGATTTDKDVEEALKDCSKTQLSMNLCAKHSMDRAEARLNKVYRCVLKAVDDPNWAKVVREAQRSWVRYRMNQCHHYAGGPPGPGSGSMSPALYGHCMAAMADSRSVELVDLGDMSIDACK